MRTVEAVNTTPLCQQCGAPWQPDVTGSCRFCRVVAPPPGTETGVAGARPSIDADSLCRLLLSDTADPDRALDRLAAHLRAVAGERVSESGSPVGHLQLTLDDWHYQAWIEHGDVSTLAVHTVRGVVLKRRPLTFDEWVACVAAHLAEYAGTNRHVYNALVTLNGT
jgi:hypothetical protein